MSPPDADPAQPPVDPLAEPLADLADLLLNVGRLVRARTPSGPEVVALTETERTVMRVVDLHPGAAPSEIARRARVRRTNVSAALQALEGKGMVERRPGTGRGVSVVPTPLARTNLRLLRAGWSRELAGVVDDRDALRRCNEVLATVERHLTSDR
ncbi:MarR family transcriptional regulator [Kineococcus sp. LSe6-4]|uniref:MarR family transcriptional regulator n=1 Tax=Kineococcus halophytocola TaxID=3234027 RepID=A0ABV4H4F7_9ACTN